MNANADVIYRDTIEPARRELARELAARRLAAAGADHLRPLFARRFARVAGGGALAGVGALMFALSVVDMFTSVFRYHRFASLGVLTWTLLSSWGIAVMVYAAARLAARRRFARHLSSALAAGEGGRGMGDEEDPVSALERLRDTPGPVEALRRRIDGLETASIALPMVGCSLLAPLTLHFLFCALVGSFGDRLSLHWAAGEFDDWIKVSVVVVGHAHLVLAGCAVRFARWARRLDAGVLALRNEGGGALYYTVVASALPGALLLFVPPLLSVFTGAAFIPLMFRWARATLVRERRA